LTPRETLQPPPTLQALTTEGQHLTPSWADWFFRLRQALVTAGTGSVSSVSLSAPAEFTVTGSPITGTGTLALTKATEAANTVWAGPTTGGAAQPAFRALAAADLPAGVGSVTSVSVTTANGVSGSVANPTTTPAISLSLGAITPSSVAASGTVTGSNLSGTHSGASSGTNTGDQSLASLGAQAGLQFDDEGVALGASATATELDFVGAGVTAARATNKVTVTIPGATDWPLTRESVPSGQTLTVTAGFSMAVVGPFTLTGDMVLNGDMALL
jgi:hypothetical protein